MYCTMFWEIIGIIDKDAIFPVGRTVSIQNIYPIGGKYGTYK